MRTAEGFSQGVWAVRAMRQAAVAAALLAVALCVACMVPGVALASMSDAASEYPATQDLEKTAQTDLSGKGLAIADGAVSASQIKAGTYYVPAYTTSYMCIMYNPDNQSERNTARIDVSGGSMTVSFYSSNAYTAFYPGTAEEAAAAAGGGSTIYGNPDSGYTPHYYSFQIAGLNESIVMATFNGGSRPEQGVWYTRRISFIATTDFVATHVKGGSSDTPDDDNNGDDNNGDDNGGGDNNAGDNNNTGDSGSEANNESNNAGAASNTEGTEPQDNGGPQPAQGTNKPDPAPAAGAAAANGNGRGAGSGGGAGAGVRAGSGDGAGSEDDAGLEDNEDNAGSEDVSAAEAGPTGGGAGAMLGRVLHIVGQDDADSPTNVVKGDEELTGDSMLTPGEVAGIVAVACLAAGVLWRMLMFNRSLNRRVPL